MNLSLLNISKESQEQIKNLLDNNQVGTPGKGMVYQLRNVVVKGIQKNYNESDLPVYIPAFDVI